jgi:hypothetical protein
MRHASHSGRAQATAVGMTAGQQAVTQGVYHRSPALIDEPVHIASYILSGCRIGTPSVAKPGPSLIDGQILGAEVAGANAAIFSATEGLWWCSS